MDVTGDPTRKRLLDAGAALFAEKGFGGASVREICRAAGTSGNMIHHYFGDKQGLLDAVLEGYGAAVYDRSLLILDPPATSKEDFAARIRLLFVTTFDAGATVRLPLTVAIREQANLEALDRFQERFNDFLRDGQQQGWVRPEVQPELVSGFLLDRVNNQVHYAPWIQRRFGVDVLTDADYRRKWIDANVDLLLHGFVGT